MAFASVMALLSESYAGRWKKALYVLQFTSTLHSFRNMK